MPVLNSIAISETSLKLNIQDVPSVKLLFLDYLNFSGVIFPYQLDSINSLSIVNCGFVFPEQSVDLSRFGGFSWANNDMSLVTATNFPDISSYDLAGTQIRGIFDFSVVSVPYEVSLSDTQLIIYNFFITQSTAVVDCANVIFADYEPNYNEWATFD